MFKLKIETGSNSFSDDCNLELARILRELANRLEFDGDASRSIKDTNGNTVGRWTLEMGL